jgi:hypothetical protein
VGANVGGVEVVGELVEVVGELVAATLCAVCRTATHRTNMNVFIYPHTSIK